MPETRFVDVRRFESIDSTNRYLLDEARAGALEGVVAVADHQSAGRGRLGRTWEAPAGANLLLSVLLRPALAPEARHLSTTAVALAAVDAIAAAVVDAAGLGVEVGIKWPNDLVAADSRKLAGVLAEADLASSNSEALLDAVVVGIGINVNWPAANEDLPPELRGAAVSLRQLAGGVVDREAILEHMLLALEPRVASLSTSEGRVHLGDDLRRKCTTLGTRVRVDLADGSFVGTAVAVSDDGQLQVDVDGVLRTVVAGDVVHVRPGS